MNFQVHLQTWPRREEQVESDRSPTSASDLWPPLCEHMVCLNLHMDTPICPHPKPSHTKPMLNNYIFLEDVLTVVDNVLKLILGEQLLLLVDTFVKQLLWQSQKLKVVPLCLVFIHFQFRKISMNSIIKYGQRLVYSINKIYRLYVNCQVYKSFSIP